MDFDFELILYIVFVLVAILSRLLKKKAPKAPKSTEREAETESQPTVTFEDLLKEFQGKGREKKPEPVRTERKPEPEPARDYDFRSSIPDDDEVQQVYEESIREAAKSPDLGSDSDRPKFEHFAVFEVEEEENEIAKEVREMLTSPQNAAKAIILGEIINRKY